MSTEQIQKFQPNRTIYLRGFDGAGAAAALYNTTSSSFTVSGVYRDMADFCVLVIYDADNIFEHYSVRYLPDFSLSGMVLSFDVSYQGLQPLDSAKYSWIDWSQLDVITESGDTAQVVLFDHATLVSGSYTPAQGTFTITTGSAGCTIYDRLTLVINDTAFDWVTDEYTVGNDADQVVDYFVTNVNGFNWATFANSSVSVIASNAGNGQLLIKYARTGYVNTDGTNLVTWTLPETSGAPAGIKFPGIASGSTIYINGTAYTVDTVTSPTTLTLTTTAPAQSYAYYLAEYGGLDGNGLTVYMIDRSGNINLFIDKTVLPLTGGNSDNVTWNISLDFTALGIDSVRQAWFTLAPQLPSSSAYADTEWTATYTNWTVSDPNNIGTLQIAGPDSVRIGNADSACTYSSAGWSVQSANNYWRGFSRVTNTTGSSVTITYTCSQTHDLYLGTSLYIDRGKVDITLDNVAAQNSTIDCYVNTGSELVTRRLIQSSVSGGQHTVVMTLDSTNNAASEGYNFIFDFLEAAVTTPDIQDPAVTYPNVSPALDYDTDATYKMSPQRILWHLQKLGFQGHMNEYLGVFWWNQRARAAYTWNSWTVTISGLQGASDNVTLTIGTFAMQKAVISTDTPDTIAKHFVYYMNSATVAVWAASNADNQFTIYTRTPNWSASVEISVTTTGTLAASAVFQDFVIVPLAGTWAAGDSIQLTLNGTAISQTFGAADTPATIAQDFVTAINAASLGVTASLSNTQQFTVTATTLTAQISFTAADSTASATVCIGGTPGYWQVDPTAANPLNFAIRQWHTDLFTQLQALNRQITTSFSMELVYPPDDGTTANAWVARFADGTEVSTNTGFANLISSQCAFIANMTNFQQQVYLAMAALQSAAGLTPWLQFGEFLWWFFSSNSFTITTLTGTSPLTIQMTNSATGSLAHGMSTGDRIVITGVNGCTAANGTWTITVLDDQTFTIPATSNAPWTASTGTVRGGSMAYYDAVTSAAAQSQLGRPLYNFTCQDDDPTVNNGEDSAFLAARLKAHIDAIRTTVLAQFPNAKFEILYPNDVNNPVCLVGPGVQYSQGGRLNAAVNLPPAWYTQPASGLDSFKVEALSWSATYLNMDLASQAIVFALNPPMSWPASNVAYLVPWFNGTCPWPREFLLAASRGLNIVNFWAYDHLSLMSWPVPLEISLERARFLG